MKEVAAAKDGESGPAYQTIHPPVALGLPFSASTVESDYLSWRLLPDLFSAFFPGVQTKRDEVVVDIDRERLEARMQTYFDVSMSNEQASKLVAGSMDSTARFDAPVVRHYLVKRGYLPQYLVRYLYRPFDLRWIYWEPETKLLGEKSPAYFPQVMARNPSFSMAQRSRRDYSPPFVTSSLASLHLIEWSASFFPLKLKARTTDLFGASSSVENLDGTNWNLSDAARRYLKALDAAPDTLFFHAIAIMHSPAYYDENTGALRQDWPRIPLPATRGALEASAVLGRQVAALLETETQVPGVTTGSIRDELKAIALLSRDGGGGLSDGDLSVTAGWGNATKAGVMPGKGKVVSRAAGVGGPAAFGEETLDVYLNASVAWRNVPLAVWRYTIGGYQVMKKWLSYREKSVLGRDLTTEEARDVQRMARRIAALLLLRPELDTNYQAVKSATYPWS